MTNDKRIAYWLLLCCFMVFAMAVIGAVTRLTESGLSITQWKPVTGALPPLNESQWQAEFDLYRQSPEYLKKNAGMSLEAFKSIFFWEWLHRLWGRMIGIVFAAPLLYFWAKKHIPAGYGKKFIALLALGGLQGAVGWWMVASGLIDRPLVSHYRLAVHLMMALGVYAMMLWLALGLLGKPEPHRAPTFCLKRHGLIAFTLATLTIIWGAFTAGLDAGMIYNEFPLMGGRIFPYEGLNMTPEWLNFLENHATVQFMHRALAICTGIIALWFAFRMASPALVFFVVLQVGLGIGTLLSQVWVPIAAIHQAGAILLGSALLWELRRLIPPSRARP